MQLSSVEISDVKAEARPEVRVAVGEVIHRFNLGRAQMSTKAMMMNAGGLIQAYIPGSFSLGRIDLSRENITKRYMATTRLRCTHLLIIDQDMIFPENMVQRLASHGLPLVAALAIRGQRDKPVPVMHNLGDGKRFTAIAEWEPGQLVPCDATGGAAVLIATEVLEAIGEPWWMMSEDGCGHDIHFFRRAKRAGYQLHVDTGCETKHFCEFALGVEDYYAWRDAHLELVIQPDEPE